MMLGYGAWWLAFPTIAYLTARYALSWCVPLGHLAVASLVFFLDIRWLHAQMRQPEWNGTPGMDTAFVLGVLIRIIVVNLIVLPATVLAIRQRRKAVPASAPA